jgi:hypothetical protein
MAKRARRGILPLCLATALLAALAPAFGAHPSPPRVTVDWTHLPLAAPTDRPGYAAPEGSVAEAVRRRVEEEGAPRRPTAVWLHRTNADPGDAAARIVPPGDEASALALGRFRTVRVDVDALRSEELRKTYSDTPAFLFFDPAGVEVSRVAGERANDPRAFEEALDTAWRVSFATLRSPFLRRMTDVLDAKEEIANRRSSFRARREALGAAPTARELRELEHVAREIERDLEEVLEEERDTLRSVRLRPRFAEK